jgi:molybdopterin adenylyltransferase
MKLRFGVLTISDRAFRKERIDLSGPALVEKIIQLGGEIVLTEIVPDVEEQIKFVLIKWADLDTMDVILTTGGTGFSPRDVTPEATQNVIERQVPGLAEAMRAASLKVTPHAMLSRSVAGIRRKTLIINLPGSPRGAVENLDVVLPVLPHAVQLLRDAANSEAGHNTG